MANTTPTFLRRFEVFAPILAGKTAPILESTYITLGFNGPVDPESGMVLNLVDVDAWIKKFKTSVGKKSYSSRWEFSLYVKTLFAQLIDRNEFSDIRIEFHNWSVWFHGTTTFLKWTRSSVLQSKKLKWRSPVTLTLLVQSQKSPPVSKAVDIKISESLETIRLDKLKWVFPGLAFSSFEYIDPKLGCSVRV